MGKVYLVLGNGRIFEGARIGDSSDTIGELVFTTSMVGYLETLTDPSYAGEIILQTFPLIGNYGVIEEDFEGRPMAKGYVVRELCESPSNFRSQYELDRFLRDNKIPGISGIDTRAITKIIREEGVMNAMITSSLPENLGAIRSYRVRGVVSAASSKEISSRPAEGEERFHVALLDYGAKENIIRCLRKRGCRVTVLPHKTSSEEVLSLSPDGLVLSNGPGDPAENKAETNELKKLLGRLPIFGICLGHQLMALAAGGETEKLKYGHRGGNQPVKELSSGRCYITSQNHGYAVITRSMEGKAKPSFINLNDSSLEGLEYPGLKCFTVQFHPEASSGPHDTEFLFDRFIEMMESEKNAKG